MKGFSPRDTAVPKSAAFAIPSIVVLDIAPLPKDKQENDNVEYQA